MTSINTSAASPPHTHAALLLPTCRENPLPAKAVLVDEASMLSLPLAAALLGALDPGCQLVLVGDVDQLPPVGESSSVPGQHCLLHLQQHHMHLGRGI